jgi:glycosyltransferase involved in cell wall biosynthesis
MPKNIVIIDANNVIAGGGIDVLVRHANYASALKTASQQSFQLVIIATRTLQDQLAQLKEGLGNDLVIHTIHESKFGRILFWKRACKVLAENEISPTLLVSGDPWISGGNAILMRAVLKVKPKIQMQLHADLFAPGWKTLSLRNFVKFQIARRVLLRADYIRTVSFHQTKNLSPYLETKQVVSCIPIPLPGNTRVKEIYSKDFKTFGFFGRLHSDRGTQFVVDKFTPLLKKHSEIRLVIAGSGPEEKLIKARLKEQFPSQVTMFGHLSLSQSHYFWNQVDVLLSVAEYESYGRAPREAIVNHVPVLATPSSGILDLSESPMGEWISLVSRDIDSEDLLDQARKVFHKAELLLKSDTELATQDSVYDLVNDWLSNLSQR